MNYLFNVAIGFDLFASAIFGGKPGETLSGRAGSAYLQGKLRGHIFCPLINWIMRNPGFDLLAPGAPSLAIVDALSALGIDRGS